jgi:hypothetical protein
MIARINLAISLIEDITRYHANAAKATEERDYGPTSDDYSG